MDKTTTIPQITEEMVLLLNQSLRIHGYAVCYKYSELAGLGGQMELMLPNDKGLLNYILNIDDELFNRICKWFEVNYGIVITCNNTRSIMWALKYKED